VFEEAANTGATRIGGHGYPQLITVFVLTVYIIANVLIEPDQ